MSFFKEQHDKLMLVKPDGVSHDAASCNICTPANKVGLNNSIEGGDMSTYNDEEFTAAVLVATREAVAPIQAELDTLRASQAEGETATLIATATEAVKAELESAQVELDATMVRATSAEKAYEDLVAYLTAEAELVAETATREAKRDERRAAVKEASAFDDAYIDANIDRWVALDEEAFASTLADWAAASKPATGDKKEVSTLSAAKETAFDTTRKEGAPVSDAKLVFGAMVSGTDIRKIF